MCQLAATFQRAGLLLALAVVLLACCSRPAHAAQGCAAEGRAWAERCTRETGLQFRQFRCPPGRMVVRVASGGGPALEVEIGPWSSRAFRKVGGYGLSPIGEYPDWNKAPPAKRRALDQLGECVRRAGTLTFSAHANPVARHTRHGTWHLPWMLLAALALLGVVVGLELRSTRERRRRLLTLLALGLSAVACYALRRAFLPFAYFHQNGQGPLWILYALRDVHGLSSYGPGYSELFGAATHALATPERGVFVLQALLGACAVPALWVVARRVGAGPLLSAALALLVLFDPVLARSAQSESYYAAGTSLLFLAAAVLAVGSWHARSRSLRFNVAVASAGLFIALAARVHPVCWVAAALVPAVVLLERGRLWRRVLLALHAALGIALVVAVAAGPAMLEVLHGALGQQWMPRAHTALHLDMGHQPVIALALAIAALLALWRRPRWRRAALGVVLVALAALAIAATDLVRNPNPPWIGYAYGALFAPTLLAALAAVLSGAVPGRRTQSPLALGVVALGALAAWHHRRLATELPTDVREEAWSATWQAKLPADSLVVYLQRAGRRVQVLPLYGTGPSPVRGFALTAGPSLPDPTALGDRVYYYRSSVCSSPEGRAFCHRIEHGFPLRLLRSRVLPAVPSIEDLHYDTQRVRVGLYQVEPRPARDHAH